MTAFVSFYNGRMSTLLSESSIASSPSADAGVQASSHQSLRNQLLIAMPCLEARPFVHSVAYVCEHTAEGAMGLVINQPSSIEIDELLEQMGLTLDPARLNYPVMQGGPIHPERGFVLHGSGSCWQHTVVLSDEFSLTASCDILEDMAAAQGPRNALVLLGFAGWEAGQLERELGENRWLTAPATPHIVFDVPFASRVQVATLQLGFDFSLLSPHVGHA